MEGEAPISEPALLRGSRACKDEGGRACEDDMGRDEGVATETGTGAS